jgi:MFS family permease
MSSAAAPHAGPTPYAWSVLALMVATTVFNVADRNLMNILIPPIQDEFGATDAEMGLLVGVAFAVVHNLTNFPVALWADRGSRRFLIAGGLFLWSGLTALSGLAQSFFQLLCARMGVSAAETTGSSPVHSLLSDYFPVSHRATALSLMAVGGVGGGALGMMIGGYVAHTWGWRQAFFIFGLPGALLALVLVAAVREPVRGAVDRASGGSAGPTERTPLAEVLRYLWRRSAYVHIVLGSCYHVFAGIGTNTWYPTYLFRVHDLNLAEAGTSFALAGPVAMALGALFAGRLTDRLGTRDVRWYMWIPAAGSALALPFSVAFVLWPAGQGFEVAGTVFPTALLFLAPASFLGASWSGPTLAMVMAIAKARMRALASAITTGAYTLVGMALGPTLVGWISDSLAPSYGEDSIRYGLLVVALAHVLGFVHNLLAIRPLAGDIAAARS